MPGEIAGCWVIRLNRLYLTQWSLGGISLDRDLQRAFRYTAEKDARFVAGKVAGEVVRCRVGLNGLEVIRDGNVGV